MLYTLAAVHRVEALAMMTVSDISGPPRTSASGSATRAAPRCRRHDPRRLPRRDERGLSAMTDIDIANADRLLTTTRSVRRRLDATRPVPERADRGVPGGRPAGSHGRQPAGLAVRRRHRSRQAPGDRRRVPQAWDVYREAVGGVHVPRDDPRAAASPRAGLVAAPRRPPRGGAGAPRPVRHGTRRRRAALPHGHDDGVRAARRLVVHARGARLAASGRA